MIVIRDRSPRAVVVKPEKYQEGIANGHKEGHKPGIYKASVHHDPYPLQTNLRP